MSGTSRAAVTVDSQMERILGYPAKVAMLEEKMKTEVSELKEFRGQLCETHSEWILEDCQSAAAADCVNRLWKKCFYERIDQARKSIARDKKKGNDTTEAKKLLSDFIKEGITLMEYLIDRLRNKLETSNPSNTTNGGSQCLSRLYICLGDLYRYDQKLAKADTAYAMASRLAPGSSHCFNQRAVVSDCREGTAVSTYWYLRAIHSNDRPGPAETNLRRLLANNRVWLQQQTVHVSDGPTLANAAIRLFLVKFVDLFHTIYLDEPIDPKAVLDCINSFQTLLQSSAFSDSLLCKMIAILAVRDVYIYDFGLCLAERVVSTLQSKTSRRTLTPLLLLVEYVLLKPDCSKKDFWQNVVTAWNLVASQKTEGDNVYLQEYDILKGYKPFEPFVGKLMHYYLSDKEACASFEKIPEESPCARIVRFRSLKSALLELDFVVENSDGSILYQDPNMSVATERFGDENVAVNFDHDMEYDEGEDIVLPIPTPVVPVSKAKQRTTPCEPTAVGPPFSFGIAPPLAHLFPSTTLPLLSGHVVPGQVSEETIPPVLAQAFSASNVPNAVGPPPGFGGFASKPLFGDTRPTLTPNSLFQISTTTANPFAMGDFNVNASSNMNQAAITATQTKQSPNVLTKNPFAS